MTKNEAEILVEKYLDSVANNDVEGIMALYADNCSLEDPVGSEVLNGRDKVTAFYQKIENLKLKTLLTSPVMVTDQGRHIAFAFSVCVETDSQQIKQDIIDIFTCNAEGKIESMRAFWGSENTCVREDKNGIT